MSLVLRRYPPYERLCLHDARYDSVTSEVLFPFFLFSFGLSASPRSFLGDSRIPLSSRQQAPASKQIVYRALLWATTAISTALDSFFHEIFTKEDFFSRNLPESVMLAKVFAPVSRRRLSSPVSFRVLNDEELEQNSGLWCFTRTYNQNTARACKSASLLRDVEHALARERHLAWSIWKQEKIKNKKKSGRHPIQPSVHSSSNVWNVCISLFLSSELHVGALIRGRDLCVSESEGRKARQLRHCVSSLFYTLVSSRPSLFSFPLFLYVS